MNCLKHLFYSDNRSAKITATAATFLVVIFLVSGCGQPPATDAPDSTATNEVSGTTVELSGDQLNAIKINPVGAYLFHIEREAEGTIYFDESPSIVQAESTLLGAAATVEVTSNAQARAQSLYETNGVSKAELEQDISAEETSEAALKAARDAVRALGLTDDDIDQMIAAGRIIPAQPAHTSSRWLLANVSESDGPSIQVGQPVQVKVAAIPGQVFAGTVSKIYATVDPNIHRMAVRCETDDPQNELRAGMLATFTIQVQPSVTDTAIPANGVVREGDGAMTAWVTTDQRHFSQRIIKTGIRQDGQVQILDGLQRGELVVTDGAVFLDNILFAPQTE